MNPTIPKKRIYVAGPVTGLPELNFPAFHAMAAILRGAGHDVVNPAEINPDTTMDWHDCMRRDIAERLGFQICLAPRVGTNETTTDGGAA